jgi:hypothetical protein
MDAASVKNQGQGKPCTCERVAVVVGRRFDFDEGPGTSGVVLSNRQFKKTTTTTRRDVANKKTDSRIRAGTRPKG